MGHRVHEPGQIRTKMNWTGIGGGDPRSILEVSIVFRGQVQVILYG